jgi:hypothetical protein
MKIQLLCCLISTSLASPNRLREKEVLSQCVMGCVNNTIKSVAQEVPKGALCMNDFRVHFMEDRLSRNEGQPIDKEDRRDSSLNNPELCCGGKKIRLTSGHTCQLLSRLSSHR